MRRLCIIVIFFAVCHTICAQKVSIAFWNVENLYDTIPSLFYDDSEYTPGGARKWDSVRYRAKMRNLARVIDDMATDVVGLAEVESETALRDLVMTLKTDYNYIHHASGDKRGIDVAMLYKGDKFFPEHSRLVKSGTRREFLHVTGELLGERVELIVCHMASNLNNYRYRLRNMETLRKILEKLLGENPAAKIIVMGDMNATPGDKVVRRTLGSVKSPYDFMYTPHWEEYHARKGTYSYLGRWYMYDWMVVSPSLARGGGITATESGIFAREYMTEQSRTGNFQMLKPLRTFYAGQYLEGYSDHFPVFLYLVK